MFETLQTSLTFKNSENAVKSEYFEKLVPWRAQIFFGNEGAVSVALHKNNFVSDL